MVLVKLSSKRTEGSVERTTKTNAQEERRTPTLNVETTSQRFTA